MCDRGQEVVTGDKMCDRGQEVVTGDKMYDRGQEVVTGDKSVLQRTGSCDGGQNA